MPAAQQTKAQPKDSRTQFLQRDAFTRRFNSLKNEYASWLPAHKELALYINPTRGFFEDQRPNDGKKIDHKTVIDGHARREAGTLAKGMTSGLTSPSRPWFLLSTGDETLDRIHAVRLFTDEVRNRMLDVFARSNIYGCLHGAYEELSTFGTAAIFLEEDYRDVIRGKLYTAGEYYLGVGPDGRVNTFGRPFWMTVAQLVEEFGLENCSPAVQMSYENNQMELWVKIFRLIEPNDKRIPDDPSYKGMTFRSLYWEAASNDGSYLRMGGYEGFPVLCPRWDTTTTADSYGRGPGWDSLGDVKMLQAMQKKLLTGLDKSIDPPVQVDGSVVGEFNSLPGGVTKFSSTLPNSGVKPAYEVRPDVAAMEAKIERVQQAISRNFFADLFLMLIDDKRQMTATEVAERQSEKLQILGPVLERLESELLNPLIERTFLIMLKNNLLPEIPKELQGRELKVQYVSILAQAQKMVGFTATQQALGFGGQLAAVRPEVMDNYDVDEIARDTSSNVLALPQKYLVPIEVRDKMRKDRADAQAKAQNLAAMETIAKAGKAGTGAVKDLGTTPLGENSALDATLEGITGRRPQGA